VVRMGLLFEDEDLYLYYQRYVKAFRKHGLEEDFHRLLSSMDSAIEVFRYSFPEWLRKKLVSAVKEDVKELKKKCSSDRRLSRIIREVEGYFNYEVEKLTNSWRYRLRRILEKVSRASVKTFKKVKELDDKLDEFIESTSIRFGLMLGGKIAVPLYRRFGLRLKYAALIFRVFDRIGYWSMRILLSTAAMAPFSIALTLLALYLYANLLAMASNRYMTHLLRLLVEVMV
jgi:phage pi2 protein 07